MASPRLEHQFILKIISRNRILPRSIDSMPTNIPLAPDIGAGTGSSSIAREVPQRIPQLLVRVRTVREDTGFGSLVHNCARVEAVGTTGIAEDGVCRILSKAATLMHGWVNFEPTSQGSYWDGPVRCTLSTSNQLRVCTGTNIGIDLSHHLFSLRGFTTSTGAMGRSSLLGKLWIQGIPYQRIDFNASSSTDSFTTDPIL